MDKRIDYNGQSVIELIKRRTSIRTYKDQLLQENIKVGFTKYFESVKGPFDVRVRFILIENNKRDEALKLGTYGVIKNAPAFIVSVVEKTGMYMEQLGYEFEKVILHAQSLGLGTCWMAGTFKKGEFVKAALLKDNEVLPVVSPVGYTADNMKLLDRFMRFAAGSKNRKPFEELFFKGVFEKPLYNSEAGKYSMPLEMVRLAPSASNKQPWRVVIKDNYFHFYLQHAKGYGSGLGFDVQKIDMGIAMCHFELTARELGLEGSWVIRKPSIDKIPESAEYIISWEDR